jgi:hypothetical protein
LDGHDENNSLRDLAMLLEHRLLLEDEPCPVADQKLGEIYRASSRALNDLIATVPQGEWIGTALTVLFATAGVLFVSFLAVWTSLV